MPTTTRGTAKDSSDGTPEISAPADVTIACPFDDGEADFHGQSGADMGSAGETDQMARMVGAAEETDQIVKMSATCQDPMAKMKTMEATADQLQATQAEKW